MEKDERVAVAEEEYRRSVREDVAIDRVQRDLLAWLGLLVEGKHEVADDGNLPVFRLKLLVAFVEFHEFDELIDRELDPLGIPVRILFSVDRLFRFLEHAGEVQHLDAFRP